ncbi:cell surface protein [Cochleicola gelatinilyticus]|uniref:Cell surface protein n=1 Tax=Cochleicola gelatinilyticus TaxID=1763537 RepID=A0A167G9C7_9FLAO|nr:cell surface protein [Cochleicola gelatinilyticus]OAB77355.1 cell surface protein [Cochleicola gelatinilyticus]
MNTNKGDFPLDIVVSFNKLFGLYRAHLKSDNPVLVSRAEAMLTIAEKYPILSEGLKTRKDIDQYREQIDIILEDVFSSVLSSNEIKIASLPYNEYIFKASARYNKIIAAAGKDFQLELNNFSEDEYFVLGCSIILGIYYGKIIDFKRPFYYSIPDENGINKSYRVLYNADFVEVEKTSKAIDITEEDIDELLENFDNVALWKEKFPPGSWIFKGFVIANMFDVTMDVSLSDFKANLLRREVHGGTLNKEFERIFRAIFNLPELRIGFSDFNSEDETFERMLYKDIDSFILKGQRSQHTKDALCDASYYTLFKQHDFYCITDTERYHKLYPKNILYKKLLDQGVRSAILASIVENEEVVGVLELVSPNANELNTINANKLKDVMPYLEDSVIRSKERLDNDLELIIQEECTAIHSSVHWKFRKEAKRYLNSIANNNPSFFREIVFDDVYPLYGQIDIKGSSEARNVATVKDLILQLEHIQTIVKSIFQVEGFPIYEQLEFRVEKYLKELNEDFQVDSERQVLKFLNTEIIPLFKHLSKKSETLKGLIDEYNEKVDNQSGFIYQHRKDYDESVMLINKRMASILDRKQVDAQAMYPHYFERFKTDGVEHNLYIGESITKKKSFHKIYLYNLRLWQLQAMCEMENSYYKLKERLAIPLDVASMILAFNSPLSLRFRMDEKRFDVDGTYNARYEVVKKRVDKANIKGTDERVTQAGKISIIYSQKEDEKEYLKYISFLQSKKQLLDDEEIVELEDLQGVTGLKAIRVSVLYTRGKDAKEYYTYEDLIAQLEA